MAYEAKQDIYNPDNYSSQGDYLKQMTKYFNLDNPAPYVTARSWVMMNLSNGEVMFDK